MSMKKQTGMVILVMILIAGALHGQVVVSQYAEGKVFTRSGFTLEGKKLRMSMESVTLEIAGQDQVLPIKDVVQVMVKRGLAKRYGKNCGIIGLGLATLSILTPDDGEENGETEDGEEQEEGPASKLVGGIMLGGLSYGVGYGIGMATDHWEVVYLKR